MELLITVRHGSRNYDLDLLTPAGREEMLRLGRKLEPLTQGKKVKILSSPVESVKDGALALAQGLKISANEVRITRDLELHTDSLPWRQAESLTILAQRQEQEDTQVLILVTHEPIGHDFLYHFLKYLFGKQENRTEALGCGEAFVLDYQTKTITKISQPVPGETMNAQDNTQGTYDSPYWEFVRETAARAERLPDWKKGEVSAATSGPQPDEKVYSREDLIRRIMWDNRSVIDFFSNQPNSEWADLQSVVAVFGPPAKYTDEELEKLGDFAKRMTARYDEKHRSRRGCDLILLGKMIEGGTRWYRCRMSWTQGPMFSATLEEAMAIMERPV